MSARLDNGLVGNIRLDSPLTVDKIRLACEDEILKKVKIVNMCKSFHLKLT